ncbi:hypothetical protein Poly59_25650 [Rubripirellula reticaptiva]|uniref:Uncharacterized protein n=2 Tax=Rubripirellula reticaptiva TaxID=2528013 RepID=A0A5C6F9S5_9BACT|nr:hypothetical protein Poly59_25650 [Rubripirellula reticaptiva]
MVLVSAAISSVQDGGSFVDLFNDKDPSGWTQRNGTATYRAEDDSIVGKTMVGQPELVPMPGIGAGQVPYEVRRRNLTSREL